MANIREVVIRKLSDAIQQGKPIKLSSYNPEPPITLDERLMDAIIRDTLKAIREKRIPAFSGISGALHSKKSTRR